LCLKFYEVSYYNVKLSKENFEYFQRKNIFSKKKHFVYTYLQNVSEIIKNITFVKVIMSKIL